MFYGKISLISILVLCMHTQAEDVRLLDLDPPEAQQHIDAHDTTLNYAPKVDSNVPAVRVLGDEPTQVLEDIYLANQYHGQDGLGGYLYGYAVPDIAKTERKKAGGDLRGAYNYKNGQGQEIKVEYWDDGTGFHQVDNVDRFQPMQIPDTDEVARAKAEHARIWAEQAERNSKPIEDPNANYNPFEVLAASQKAQAALLKQTQPQGYQGQVYNQYGYNKQQPASGSGNQQQHGQQPGFQQNGAQPGSQTYQQGQQHTSFHQNGPQPGSFGYQQPSTGSNYPQQQSGQGQQHTSFHQNGPQPGSIGFQKPAGAGQNYPQQAQGFGQQGQHQASFGQQGVESQAQGGFQQKPAPGPVGFSQHNGGSSSGAFNQQQPGQQGSSNAGAYNPQGQAQTASSSFAHAGASGTQQGAFGQQSGQQGGHFGQGQSQGSAQTQGSFAHTGASGTQQGTFGQQSGQHGGHFGQGQSQGSAQTQGSFAHTGASGTQQGAFGQQSGQQGGHFGQGQGSAQPQGSFAHAGVSGISQGSYGKQLAQGYNQQGGHSAFQNQPGHYSGQHSETKSTFVANPHSGAGGNDGHDDGEYRPDPSEDNGEYKPGPEEQGPPKGFFYNFDYPVGIIVSKQGSARQQQPQQH